MYGAYTLFPTLLEALKAGYQVYDKGPGFYLLRQRTSEGWKEAQVVAGGVK